MGWNETDDHFVLGTTTSTANSTGSLSVTAADLSIAKLMTTKGTVGPVGESIHSSTISGATTTETTIAVAPLIQNKHTVSCGKIFIAIHDSNNTKSYMSVSDYIHAGGSDVSFAMISQWLKEPGDKVEKEESVVVIETDKVTIDLVAPISGVIEKVYYPQGSKVTVGDIICKLR